MPSSHGRSWRKVCSLEISCFSNCYNHSRPHSSRHGRTPHEVYHDVLPACQRPRYEPRPRWPRSAPCASPPTPVAGHCGAHIRLDAHCHGDRKHLPIVELRRAAQETKRFGISRHRLYSRCRLLYLGSDLDQVCVLKQLRGENVNSQRPRPVNCRASTGLHFRWATTASPIS